MSLLEAKSQVCHFLAARYAADLEDPLLVAPEEVSSIDVLAGDMDGAGDWDLADLTGDPDLK